jgi:hypothetical protein
VFVREGAVWSEQQKLTASDGELGDQFGVSVAISGETIVVGAPGDNGAGASNQGSAYVFARTGATWAQQQKLTASDGAADDFFGVSVAISGETMVVGAFSDDVGANIRQGSAYVFLRAGATWSEQQKLTASDGAASDAFGNSVAIDGETIVVGAQSDSVGTSSGQGSAYVFVRSGAVWSEQQKLTASDGLSGDFFGQSVAISAETVVVGAEADDLTASDQGSAYVFVRAGAVWSQQKKLTSSDGAVGDHFGFSVAISGENIVVGALFDDVGANSNQGSAYVFVRTGSVWSQAEKLLASDGAFIDQFGQAVAISGETVVVGAPLDDVGTNANQGSAYVFACAGTQEWVEQAKTNASDGAANDNFGSSVAISGETVVVGAFRDDVGANVAQGSAYVFVRAGTLWSQQQKLTAPDGAAGEFFGRSVGISGESVVVGAPGDTVGPNTDQGSAYVFVRTGTAWSEQQKLIASNGAARDRFAFSVAISGETIVVGTFHPDAMINIQRGSAYVFVRTGAVWSQQQILTASDGIGGDDFGQSVAIDGETLVVGAEGDDVGTNGDQGSAYVFVRAGAAWSELQKLTASDGATGDAFGQSVGISGETIAVGASLDNGGGGVDQGSAYIFLGECIATTPPTITASPVTVQQGQSVTGAGIATVSDNEDAASTLAVSVVSGGTATGVTLTNISNTNGAITANVAASCNANSGTVRLRVTDSTGLTGEADLQVNVTPKGPPVITCPANITAANAAGQCSATVNFSAAASDDCDGSLTPTCLPASGSSFNVGTTTVTCSVTDTSGNAAQCSFTVKINDSQSPTVTCPANITKATASGQCSAVVTYANATATDNCPGIGTPVCAPPSGSSFLKGVTTVTCTATDAAGLTASCTFTVTVNDTQPPVITCPASIVGVTPGPNASCLAVNYPAPAASDNCPGVTTVCNPPSGTCFPLGTTTVTCVATDSAGNSAQCGFTVTTFDFCLQDDSTPGTALSFNSQTGDYRFCTGGASFTGKGTVSKQGLTVTLTHSPSDRRVQARVDGAANRATASLQSPPGVIKCTITDRNLNNNTCSCQ